MATTVTLNGQTYSVPAVGAARTWGTSLSNYLIAISTSVLQKSGGAFTLTADANFGTTYGVISAYFKSYAANAAGNIATNGIVRLGNAESIAWRNNANAANVALKVNASDRLEFDGVAVPTISSTDTLTNKTLTDSTTSIADESDPTKTVVFSVGGGTTGKTTTIISAPTDNRSITMPNATDTLVGKDTTDTLTNKTLTSPVLNTGVSGTAVLDEDDMASNSASKIATQQSIKAYVDTSVAAAGVAASPSGVISAFAGSSAPTGWLLCYGQAVSRATYAALFTAISTAYGVGDGSTTFNVPDLRGRTIAALDNMGGSDAGRLDWANTIGTTGGAQTHTLSTSEIPAHSHDMTIYPTGGTPVSASPQSLTSRGTGTTYTTANAGSGGSHNNMQPTMLLNYIIKT